MAASKCFDFMSDATVHTAGERSIKTENHHVSRDFQLFLDSAAIELDVFNDLIFDLSLLRCSCFMHHAVLPESVKSSWPHFEVDQITNVEKSASLAGSLFLKCSRHLL